MHLVLAKVDIFQPFSTFVDRYSNLNLAQRLGISATVLIFTYALSRFASHRVRVGLERQGLQKNASVLISRTIWFITWGIGIGFVFGLFQNGLAPLAAVIGVVGLAASLSLQAVLQNLVAGIYLLAERPFEIGDTITVTGGGVTLEGVVVDIQMRTTQLRSVDNEPILVPNGTVFTGVVVNRTAVGGFVTHVSVTFPRETTPDEARDQAFPMLDKLACVLARPEPQLRVDKVSKDTWTGTLAFWSERRDAASDVIWAVGSTFPEATVNDAAVAV